MTIVTPEKIYEWRQRYEALSYWIGNDDCFIVKCIAAADLQCRSGNVVVEFDKKRQVYECRCGGIV